MRHIFLFFLALIFISSCKQQEPVEWVNLLDKDLSQWDNYLSYSFKEGYSGVSPVDSLGVTIPPIGINKNEYEVFTVIDIDKEPVLKVSGEIYGCVYTKEEFENYHFRLQFKWGDKKFTPRQKLLKDTGILYHSQGVNGAEYWKSWMLSQEFQIMEGHIGDYWSQANSAIDIKAYPPEYIMSPIADESQPFIAMGEGQDIKGYCMRSANYEKAGEWNTLELICFDNKSIHIVNGQVVMILKNSRTLENGNVTLLNKGKIQLQSEAAEVFYKNIEIRELEAMPTPYLTYFKN